MEDQTECWFATHLNIFQYGSNELECCDEQRTECHRAQMISQQIIETGGDRRVQCFLISMRKPKQMRSIDGICLRGFSRMSRILPCEKPCCHRTSYDHMLTSN